MFVEVRNNKTQQFRYSVVVYQKYLIRLGKMIIFSPRLENYQFSHPRLIFLINGNTIYVFSIYPRKTNVFGGILELACLSIHVSVCVHNTTFCQRAGGGIKSPSRTALFRSVFTVSQYTYNLLDR